ncbi:MAG: hypothetical protein HYV07_27225 [Deltaproteobacteria bacterium]|nr:hypothetical protein [Deltaproteobacteria bacterium]
MNRLSTGALTGLFLLLTSCASSKDVTASGRWEKYPGCDAKQCQSWYEACSAECVNDQEATITECENKCRAKQSSCESSCPG